MDVQSGGAGFQQCAVARDPARPNPVTAAMDSYEGGPNKSRFSWDPLTTVVAVRGAAAMSCSECTDCDGTNRIDASTGDNTWVKSAAKTNQTFLVLHDGKAAGEALDKLLCQVPKNGPTPPPTPRGAWTQAKGANCYGTRDGGKSYHGATDLETPASASCGVMSLVDCEARCRQTEGCGGITVAPNGGLFSCFRKRNIDLSKCDQNSGFDTWVLSE